MRFWKCTKQKFENLAKLRCKILFFIAHYALFSSKVFFKTFPPFLYSSFLWFFSLWLSLKNFPLEYGNHPKHNFFFLFLSSLLSARKRVKKKAKSLELTCKKTWENWEERKSIVLSFLVTMFFLTCSYKNHLVIVNWCFYLFYLFLCLKDQVNFLFLFVYTRAPRS